MVDEKDGALKKAIVIIPAYNEQDSIVHAVNAVIKAGYDYVIVNDGSSDKTLSICHKNSFNVLDLSRNLGIGGAVQAGYKYALAKGYDIAVQFDGDGQHDVSSLMYLIESVASGTDLAIGSRFLKNENKFKSTFMRRVGSRWLSLIIRLFGGQISDPTSGFRACSKKAIQLFGREYPMDYPEPESIVAAIKSGLVVEEVPVVMHERVGGESSIGMFSSAYYMIKVTLAIMILGVSSGYSKGKA